jgi:hypothetical protein
MNAKEFAEQMKGDIEEAKSKGTAVLECDKIIAYLNGVPNSPHTEMSPQEIEHYKAYLVNHTNHYKYELDSALERSRAAINTGQNAIKAGLILNGAAALALLAFISHLAQGNNSTSVYVFADCLAWFAYGALDMGVVSALAYLTQWLGADRESWSKKTAEVLNVISIIAGLFSYYLFSEGILSVQSAFDAFNSLNIHEQSYLYC